jgi:hypothetical protein
MPASDCRAPGMASLKLNLHRQRQGAPSLLRCRALHASGPHSAKASRRLSMLEYVRESTYESISESAGKAIQAPPPPTIIADLGVLSARA